MLLRVGEEPTPHRKAILIEDANRLAINAMSTATPYKKLDAVAGADNLDRVTKHLMLEVSKIFDKALTNPRLFTQLMFILLFNVPQNEEIMYRLIKK